MTDLTGAALERLADQVVAEFRERKAKLSRLRAEGVEHCEMCGRIIGKALKHRRKKSEKRKH